MFLEICYEPNGHCKDSQTERVCSTGIPNLTPEKIKDLLVIHILIVTPVIFLWLRK
jgi:hypothetical protein